MKYSIYLSLLFVLNIFFISCEKENISNNDIIKAERLYFDYKEKSYVLTSYLKTDSSIIYDNPNTASLYQEIIKLPKLSTFIKNDSTVIFFDTDNDLIKYIESTSQSNKPVLKDIPIPMAGVRVIFDKDKNYKGETLVIAEPQNTEYHNMPSGWNDEISSFKFEEVGLRGGLFMYIDPNFAGKSLYYEIKINNNFNPTDYHSSRFLNAECPNLSGKVAGDGIFGFFRPTFNDSISSFKFIIFWE